MYIGDKEIKEAIETQEMTPGGTVIVEVEYADGSKERFSDMMYQKIKSEESCDATALREKRVIPIVEMVMAVLRDWGIKLGELGYMSAVLNQSLEFNKNEAINQMFGEFMIRPNSLDDVDLLALDRVLKASKKTLADII